MAAVYSELSLFAVTRTLPSRVIQPHQPYRPLSLRARRGRVSLHKATPQPATGSTEAEWEFNTELVDASHTIRTWDVYRIVQSQKVEKQIKEMTKFQEKLNGEAAQQCKEAIATLELAKQALEADCIGDECGFQP